MKDIDVRPFPVYEIGEPVGYIPWWLAEIAYEAYVKAFGDRQSLERICERGGWGRDELMYLLTGRITRSGLFISKHRQD